MKTLDPCTAQPGDKVIFAYPHNGYSLDQERAINHLVVGKEYTIEFVDVGSWSSVVCLKEVPRPLFNSVLFAVWDDEDTMTAEPTQFIPDGRGGVVSLNDATSNQMKDEIKRLIDLTEYVDTHISVIASTIDTWRNKK